MNRKVFTLAVFTLGAFVLMSCDNDDSDENLIEAQDLPQNAQDFVSAHFPGVDYARVEKNASVENDGALYEVELNNNFEIDFTGEGDWVDIDGENQELPEGIVPEGITNYISENYPDLFITGIDAEKEGIEVELSNDLDVFFDTEGNFVREN